MRERTQPTRRDGVVIAAILLVMTASISLWKQTHSDAMPLTGLTAVALIIAADCFWGLRPDQPKARRRKMMGIGAVMVFLLLLAATLGAFLGA